MSQTNSPPAGITPVAPVQHSFVLGPDGVPQFFPDAFKPVPAGARPISYDERLAWSRNPNLVWNEAVGAPISPHPDLTNAQFMALFTAAEFQATVAATAANPAILGGFIMAFAQQGVSLASPALAAWLDELIAAGSLAAARKPYVLAGMAPV